MLHILGNIIRKITAFDHTVHSWIIAHQNKPLKLLFQIITSFGYGIVWFLLYPVMYHFGTPEIKTLTISIFLSELIGLLVIIIMRNIIIRPRPKPNAKRLIDYPWNDRSFPSHHALRASVLATCFGAYYPSAFLLLICAATLIIFSRIYLQKHYLSDVFTGSIIGTVLALLSLKCAIFCTY